MSLAAVTHALETAAVNIGKKGHLAETELAGLGGLFAKGDRVSANHVKEHVGKLFNSEKEAASRGLKQLTSEQKADAMAEIESRITHFVEEHIVPNHSKLTAHYAAEAAAQPSLLSQAGKVAAEMQRVPAETVPGTASAIRTGARKTFNAARDALSGNWSAGARMEAENARLMRDAERQGMRNFRNAMRDENSQAAKDMSERVGEAMTDNHIKMMNAKADARVDELVNGPAREAAEKAAEAERKAAQTPKKKFKPLKTAAIGGAALGGGAIAYNMLNGGGASNDDAMAQQADQAAMRDATQDYDAGVRFGQTQPDFKVFADNSNHEGMVQGGVQLGRV